MKIKIESITLENYKKFKEPVTFYFYDKTKISGKNQEGKSTILNAYMEILTGKEYEGKQPDGIRPQNQNNEDLNLDNVIREVTLLIDNGKKVEKKTIRKITERKMVKHHGALEKVSGGNQTTYEDGDGYKMSKKDFEEFIKSIADPKKLLMCSNPKVFLGENDKSTTKGRKIIENMSGFDLEVFIKANPQYSEANKILNSHGVEETWKNLSDKSRQAYTILDKKNTELNYEQSRDSGVKMEISNLELAKCEWKEKISEVDRQEQALDEVAKAYDSVNAEIISLKAKLNEISNDAGADLREQRALLGQKISELNIQNKGYSNDLKIAEMDLNHSKKGQDRHFKERERLLAEWEKEKSKKFSWNNSDVCEISGEICAFIKDKNALAREKAEESFNLKQQQKIKEIEELGAKESEYLKISQSAEKEAEQKIKEIREKILSTSAEIEKLCGELDKLPKSVDLSKNTEYRELSEQIKKKEFALSAMNNGAVKRVELRKLRNQYVQEISKLDAQVQKSIADEEQKQRKLSELKAEFDKQKQLVANIERDLDILKQFSIKKNAEIEKMVNQFMYGFRFSFLEFTEDGEPKEVCDIIRNGVKYKDMNYSDRLLTEVSMIRGFQKMNNLDLPIWIDNSESINDERLPELDTQMIVLKVTSDSLKVEPF